MEDFVAGSGSVQRTHGQIITRPGQRPSIRKLFPSDFRPVRAAGGFIYLKISRQFLRRLRHVGECPIETLALSVKLPAKGVTE